MTTDKSSLHEQLDANRRATVDYVNALSDERFTAQLNGKWSAAETLQHLFLSTRALNRALSSPREFFDQWPRADRPSRSSDRARIFPVLCLSHSSSSGAIAGKTGIKNG